LLYIFNFEYVSLASPHKYWKISQLQFCSEICRLWWSHSRWHLWEKVSC